MTDDLYYRKMESTSTTDLVDMIRERDERIEELENANTKISAECHKLVESLEQKQNRIKELEKHNEEIIALIHAERERQEKCDDVHLQRIADLEKENAEMKDKNKSYEEIIDNGSITLVREKLKNYKQLIKAKGIIKDYMIIVKGGNVTVCSVPEENRCINILKLNEQAEQFLKEDK